ncbi:uncharacterized protein EV420DRAFT_88878 [Desarmillaria tabescens]|uniref:Protein kinase domain-containing protein n=1 Tax=Armillaria tabescens TaxID=1929756 RepID=A0AA39NQQ8_ARMTA|nr:uncharacterized protein EV420DRAFT_88878 [Desarmillaria tabescens]KAK0470080.1 hypothetical protein EV420DRAFT_88878 [Desarmillaria tabescens]
MALFQVQGLSLVLRHSSRFLDIEDAASGLGKLEKTPKDEPGGNRTIEESDVALKEELFVRTGLRLHLAQVGGKCAVVKVFEGKDASKNYAAAVKFEEHLMHPHILHPKKISRVNIPTPFIVYDLDAQGSAEQFIAAAIPSGVVSTFVAGAQLISGIASALSHLCLRGIPFHSVRIENFSIFISGANKVVLSFDGIWNSTSFASRQDRTGLDVLGELCHQVPRISTRGDNTQAGTLRL